MERAKLDSLDAAMIEAQKVFRNGDAQTIMGVFRLSIEAWTEQLITADGERRIQLQGSIQDVREILREIESGVVSVDHSRNGGYIPE